MFFRTFALSCAHHGVFAMHKISHGEALAERIVDAVEAPLA
jgi:hypothetical protein